MSAAGLYQLKQQKWELALFNIINYSYKFLQEELFHHLIFIHTGL